MMNLLYEEFPQSVLVCGKDKQIITDFRDWLRFYDMLRDDKLSDGEKIELMSEFYRETLNIREQQEMQEPLLDFFLMKGTEDRQQGQADAEQSRRPLFDFAFDARCIIADFRSAYGIDLLNADLSLHWWKFRILLDGLPDNTAFKQRIMYRNTNTAGIKDIHERQRIQKIQRSIALPQPKPTDYEMGDIFW